MKNVIMQCEFLVYQEQELTPDDAALVRMACEATATSYSPYSHFQVGAAVRLASGYTVSGSNQENAAYGICQCADRNALFTAACQRPDDKPVAIAVAAQTSGLFLTAPIPPCGACRQAMLEVEERYGSSLRILLYGTSGVWVCDGIANLLPLKFVGETMAMC